MKGCFVLSDRDCNNCIYSTKIGCSSWSCEFIPVKEAAHAWKVIKFFKDDIKNLKNLVSKLEDIDE